MLKIALGVFGLMIAAVGFGSTDLPTDLLNALPPDMRPGNTIQLVDTALHARLVAERDAARAAMETARRDANRTIETQEMAIERQHLTNFRTQLAQQENRRLELQRTIDRNGASSTAGRNARREMATLLNTMSVLEVEIEEREAAIASVRATNADRLATFQRELAEKNRAYSQASAALSQAERASSRHTQSLSDVLAATERTLNQGNLLIRIQDLQNQFGHLDADLNAVKGKIIASLEGTALDFFVQDRVANGLAAAFSSAAVCQKIRNCNTGASAAVDDSFLRDVKAAVEQGNSSRSRAGAGVAK